MKNLIGSGPRKFLAALGTACCSIATAATAACPPASIQALTAAQAFARLEMCNPEVLLAQNMIAAAKADLQTADRGQNPTLTVGGATINPQSGIGPGPLSQKQVDWQARIDQVIERGNKRALRTAAAEHAIVAAQSNAAETLRQQRLALANAWVDLWAAQERVKVLADIVTLYQRTEDAAEKRLHAGDIAANDLLRISVDTQRAQNDLRQAATDQTRAQFALAAILAMEAEARTLSASEPWPAMRNAIPADTDMQRTARPDIRAAQAQLEAARANRDLALSLKTRDVSVGMQFDRYAPPTGTGNTVSLSVSMPLFIRHANEGEIARAEADYTSALLGLRKVEQQAYGEQKRIVLERQEAYSRAERIREQQLPLVEKMTANAELSYKKGASGVLDLLEALKQLRQIQLDAIAAQSDFQKLDAAGRAALAAGSTDDPLFADPSHQR